MIDNPTTDYGAISTNLSDHSTTPFYITTAIAYTNGDPHIGHAYEFLTADALARCYRLLGYNTFFLTGSDEHGQKVAASAEKSGLLPIQHCDHYVSVFKELHKKLLTTYNEFMRTTNPRHELCAQRLWKLCADAGDIYLDQYEGWYNEREELFVTDLEAEATEYKDPGTGLPLKRVTEESYFFRLSRFSERLITHIEQNPLFIQPEQYKNNILLRLQKEGLKDLSISRTSFSWGIPVPEGFDSKHVMYVWFDALSNYLTGVNALDVNDELSSFWPANCHIIGKDIIWFHCVIWPCMLMSARIPLPGGVFSHGFVNASDGRKMSKSYNNAINPFEILNKFPVDSLRYYVCSSATYGSDLNFSEPSLVAMHNSELNDIVGNLIHRVFNLTHKYCGGVVPDIQHDSSFPLPFSLQELVQFVREDMTTCSLNSTLFRAMESARATNRFLTEAEPWKLKGEVNDQRRKSIVRTSLEAVYAFMHFLAPFIPLAAAKVFTKLNSPPKSVGNLRIDFYNLIPGTPVHMGDILFQKIDANGGIVDSQFNADTTQSSSVSTVTKSKNETKSTSNTTNKKANTSTIDEVESQHEVEFTKLDLRVGEITKVWYHETSEKLFCEEINIGDRTIQVASGLRQHYSLEDMLGRRVVVVCNLKESKFQGFLSQGMVLAAVMKNNSDSTSSSIEGGDLLHTDQKVELVQPPLHSQPGDRIVIDKYRGTPWTAAKIKKGKVWENASPDLKTNENCIVCWKGFPLFVDNGPSLSDEISKLTDPCKVVTLVNAMVS